MLAANNRSRLRVIDTVFSFSFFPPDSREARHERNNLCVIPEQLAKKKFLSPALSRTDLQEYEVNAREFVKVGNEALGYLSFDRQRGKERIPRSVHSQRIHTNVRVFGPTAHQTD